MNPEQVKEHDSLIAAVNTLITEVRALNDKMKYYAPREEVRKEGRSRAWRFLTVSIVTILLAQVMTMTTISYCFLDASGQRKPACGLMPGYNEALAQSDVRVKRFEYLISEIDRNQAEVQRLNIEVEKLKKGQQP